jgi:hypothetical protein
MFRMRRMCRVLGVVRMLRVFRTIRDLAILGRPLLAAPGQPGRAAKRVLLHLHAPMLAVRASNGRPTGHRQPLIGVAIGALS